MTEAWGGAAVAMTLEAGLAGTALLLAALLFRTRASWRAGLLLLGLLQFLVPPLVALPVPAAVLTVEIGGDPVLADTGTVLAAVAWVQAAGVAVGVGLLARSALGLRRILRRARRVRSGPVHDALARVAEGQGTAVPRLYLTGDVGPLAAGLVRPAVLLPRKLARELDAGALRMVLAHEVAHLRRRDPLAGVVRRLAVSLWWFHPVVWVLALMHRSAAEDACDDAAAAAGDPGSYCDALLAAAGCRTPASAAGLGRHSLERRFRRLHRRMGGEPAGASRPRATGAGRAGARARRWLVAAAAAAGLLAAPLGLPSPDADGRADPDQRIIIRHVVR